MCEQVGENIDRIMGWLFVIVMVVMVLWPDRQKS